MKKREMLQTLIFILFVVSGLMVVGARPGQAQEPSPPPPLPPVPPVWNLQGLVIEYQRVDVTIAQQVATTHIEQLFVNEGGRLLEGTYLFPLPEGAAVNQLTMWVDGQPIEAKILEADEARAIYDEIVRQVRDPALLEYVGQQAIQANVFPIPAGDERRIEIEYTHLLPADNGLIHYVYPQSTDLYSDTALDRQNIRVEISSNEAIRALYSPSHRISVSREGEFRAIAGYEAEAVIPEKDFELYYTVTPEEIGLNLLSYKERAEDGFFLMLVAPTVAADPETVVARDLILVIDTSGSMEGEKIAQARDAARYVVDHLNPRDRFNLIAFSTGVRSYTPSLTPVSADGAVQGVGQFIESLDALGGTNISLALLEAMNQADPERPPTIIFLTDGLATEGIVETPLLLETVADAAPAGTRLFAFGVGDDVDTLLLDSLAENHRGTTTYVRPGQAIDEAVGAFYAKVSMPVLANLSLEVDGVTVEQQYPQELPDLFAGSQLVLSGRYREGGPATITLRGEVNGEIQTFVYEDHLFRRQGGADFIPRLWATRAIGHLLQQIRLHGESEELVQSVVNLSIRYGIITPYTSYLIEEDDIFTQSGRQIIVEEELEEAAAEPALVTGAEAVDKAAAAGEMAEAEAPLALPTQTVAEDASSGGSSLPAPRLVGSKTFVYRDGKWVDTDFDAEVHTPEQIGFAGDTYFDLLEAAPELGQYLALGTRVLVVYQGIAYEVVEGEGEAAITVPQAPAATAGAGTAQNLPQVVEPSDPQTPADPVEGPTRPASSAGFCAAALIVPLFLAATFSLNRGYRRRQ